MSETHELKIIFPTKEAKDIFAAWMSDGGGECQYFDAMEQSKTPSLRIGYHGVEKNEFPRNDARRYGKFMCDNIMRVEVVEQETP